MAWILDEYSKFHGYSPAVVTGKPTVSIYIYIYIERERERNPTLHPIVAIFL